MYLVRIGPEQIAEQALVGHVGGSHDATNLLHRLQIRRETAVTAEDLLIDDRRYRQAVKTVSERFPQLNVVASLACKQILSFVSHFVFSPMLQPPMHLYSFLFPLI